MGTRLIYKKFEQVEDSIRRNTPATLYKYRDWDNKFNRQTLTENTLWLAHPKDLNDPYDIRVPVTFDVSEIEHPAFYREFRKYGKVAFAGRARNSQELEILLQNKLCRIKEDPATFFEANVHSMRNSNLFDGIGVLSLSAECMNPAMWAYYGSNSHGFCMGFDTIELLRDRLWSFGPCKYSDEPIRLSLINPPDRKNELFLKSTTWSQEREYRCIELSIKTSADRAIKFNKSILKEVLLGTDIQKEHEAEIIKILKHSYDSKVLLFKMKHSTSGYKLERAQIDY